MHMQKCYEKRTNMKKAVIISCWLLSAAQTLKAQSTFAGGLFPTIDHAGKITQQVDYSLYYFGAFPIVNLKKPNISKDANLLLFYSEQALTFNVNKHLSFTGSYVYQREKTTAGNYLNENRVFVQTTYKHLVKTVNLKHRLRFDNRFVRNTTTGKTPNTHRLRYLIGLDFPIKTRKNNIYFTAYEEAFFNTYRNAGAFYGENWAYAAIGVKLNNNNKIETGPLYITWNTGGNNWFHQYYLQLTWLSYLDFTRPTRTK
jgi:Protein of unknown function (DUF2490)